MNEKEFNLKDKEKLIPVYIEKWQKILYSTTPINRAEAIKAIEKACEVINLPKPEIVFLDSPRQTLEFLAENEVASCSRHKWFKFKLANLLRNTSLKFGCTIYDQEFELIKNIRRESYLFEDCCYALHCDVYESNYISQSLFKIMLGETSSAYLCEEDFFIEELNLSCDQTIWHTLKSLAQECPYSFYFTDVCLVIERPTELHFDSSNRIHREGQPAVRFIDGDSIYAYHGEKIPEKYGKYSYSQWQPQWFLSENNQDLKVLLLRIIGYDRFRQELPARMFYDWQDYQQLTSESVEIISYWFDLNYEKLGDLDLDSILEPKQMENLIRTLPFIIPQEVCLIYRYLYSNLEIAPNLFLYPFPEIIKNYSQPDWITKGGFVPNSYAVPLFYGKEEEVYYIVCSPRKQESSAIWYVKGNSPPKICSMNVASLMLIIAECYEKRVYYLVVEEQTGAHHLNQDKSKLENIFKKFNPDYLDVWKQIWDI